MIQKQPQAHFGLYYFQCDDLRIPLSMEILLFWEEAAISPDKLFFSNYKQDEDILDNWFVCRK